MSKLQRKVELADKQVKKQVSSMMKLYLEEIGSILDKHFTAILSECAMTMVHMDKITLPQLLATHSYASLKRFIHTELNAAAKEVEVYWFHKRRYVELLSRVGMTYVNKKAGPPWISTKIDLKKPVSVEDRFDPRKGHIQATFSRMANSITTQIEQGALKGESGGRILMRVKNMFNRARKKGIREAKKTTSDDDINSNDQFDPVDEVSDEYDMQGPVKIQYGFFNDQDIAQLDHEMNVSNELEFRQYRPWFSDELVANNTQLYNLEQTLYSDAINLVSSGQADSLSGMKGIQSLVWTVRRPGVCPCCDRRDGLTTDEIKDQIKDEYGSKPPSLHPNCRCELVPKISDAYQSAPLEQQGVSWDPGSGKLSVPDDVKDKYKLDLSLPDFVQYLKHGGGE